MVGNGLVRVAIVLCATLLARVAQAAGPATIWMARVLFRVSVHVVTSWMTKVAKRCGYCFYIEPNKYIVI